MKCKVGASRRQAWAPYAFSRGLLTLQDGPPVWLRGPVATDAGGRRFAVAPASVAQDQTGLDVGSGLVQGLRGSWYAGLWHFFSESSGTLIPMRGLWAARTPTEGNGTSRLQVAAAPPVVRVTGLYPRQAGCH